MADDDRVAELSARLAALASEMEVLRGRLDETRATIDLTMRGQGRCRACGARSVLHARSITGHVASGGFAKMAIALKSPWTGRTSGELEAYICAACGMVEWYVKDPGELKEGKMVKRVEPADDGGPYR